MEFDEEKAIEFIREQVGKDIASKYDDDQLLNVLDIIWDYYEDHGFLDINMEDDDEEVDIEALVKHTRKMLAKDRRAGIDAEDIEALVRAELAYEDTVDEF